MKNPWIIVGIIAVLLFGGAIFFSNQANENYNEGVTVTDHVTGNPDAEVTLVEYSDLQCPACGAFYPYVEEVLEEYGDDIRFEYKHFPLPTHPYAVQAAAAAEAAGQQGKFFEYVDMLFENQSEWSESTTPNVFFTGYAEELDLDVEQFERQQKSTILRDKIEAEFQEGREAGVSGTPTFFLNGERMVIETYEGFKDQIRKAVEPEKATEGKVNFGL